MSMLSVAAMLALTGSVSFESFITKTFLTDACVSREHMTGRLSLCSHEFFSFFYFEEGEADIHKENNQWCIKY